MFDATLSSTVARATGIVETKRHKVDEDANNIGLYIDFVMIMFIVCTISSLSQHHAPPWINDAFLYLL